MKRFLSASLIALALAASAYAPLAHALDPDAEAAANAIRNLPSTGASTNSGTPVVTPASNGAPSSAPATPASPGAAQTPTPFPQDPTGGATFGPVMAWIMSLFAWLVGVAALTLDNAVFYTVVGMGKYVNNLDAIGVAWRVLRDIGNIALIFGFLAIGITTILNVGWYGGGKKLLPMLLIAAVFLNFSLFVSEAVIDTGNLFATQIYTQINGGTLAGAKGLSTKNEGISNAIMSKLGLQGIYNGARRNATVLKAGNSWVIGFMGILLFLVTAFVMFSLAFILIARFVMLIFLIILSPVGFAGIAIPKLKNLAMQWWDKLFEQTLTAPVLLLCLYIALRVILDPLFLTGFGPTSPDAWTSWVGGGSVDSYGSLILSFLVAMGLLLAVTMFSKKLSAFGAGWATKTAGKLSFGVTAAGMRYTGGFASQWLSKKAEGSRLARIPVVGRSVLGVLDRGAKGSFDIRGTSALKPMGIDAGVAQKGGYRAEMEEAIKGREAHAKRLELTGAEKREKTAHETAQKAAEREKARIEAENERDMRALLTQHQVAIQPFTSRVDAARQALAAAQATGNPAAISSAQLAFNNELRDYQRQRDEQKRESDELKKVHDQLIKVQQDEITARKGLIAAINQKPQVTYANRLEWGPNKFFYQNTKAADNIRKNAGKTKEEKDVDALMDLLKKAAPQNATTPTAPPAQAPSVPSTTP